MTSALTFENNKNLWGPAYWTFIHTLGARYPHTPSLNDKIVMIRFINDFPFLLPCIKCRTHASTYLSTHSSEIMDIVKSRTALFSFFWAFHNAVNWRLKKPQVALETARDQYGFYDK